MRTSPYNPSLRIMRYTKTMKIFLICSKSFYDRIPTIKKELELMGHTVTLPNSYDNPLLENEYRDLGKEEHSQWKAKMFKRSTDVIGGTDSVFVLNLEKNGVKNYIGGATFLEMYDAFRMGKKIYLYNDIPEGMLQDEIIGFSPLVLNGELQKLK